MQMASALSNGDAGDSIINDVSAQILAGMNNRPIDLLLLFISARLLPQFTDIAAGIRSRTAARAMLCVTAESVLGNNAEIERGLAVAAFAQSLPGVTIDHFHLADEEWPELLGESRTLRARLDAGPDLRLFIMFGDPFTAPVVQLLDACTREFPGAPVIGGMASGISEPGQTRLMINDAVFSSGLIGVSLSGPVTVDCVVSQGCRPIGRSLVVSRGHDNVIELLDDEPAISVLRGIIQELPVKDRDLVEQRSVQVGRVIDERKGNFGPGDFLVRNILGVHRPSSGLLIGDIVQSGQIIQFQLQDARTAEEDLRLLLEGQMQLGPPPGGALMFSCNGRGTRLFNQPGHDIQTLHEVLGPIPVAGFFCAGELGPVGGRNFIHGQTVSLALFR